MRFTVVWTAAAEQELARLWLQATDRHTISTATRKIDQRLQHDPDEAGESRPGNVRVLLLPPLGVIFDFNPHDAIVRVYKVWRFDTHGK